MSLNSIEYTLLSSVLFFVLNEQNLIDLLDKEKCHNTWQNIIKTLFFAGYIFLYLFINKQQNKNNIQIVLFSSIILFLLSVLASTKSNQLNLGENDKKCPNTLSVFVYSLVFGGIIYIMMIKNDEIINKLN